MNLRIVVVSGIIVFFLIGLVVAINLRRPAEEPPAVPFEYKSEVVTAKAPVKESPHKAKGYFQAEGSSETPAPGGELKVEIRLKDQVQREGISRFDYIMASQKMSVDEALADVRRELEKTKGRPSSIVIDVQTKAADDEVVGFAKIVEQWGKDRGCKCETHWAQNTYSGETIIKEGTLRLENTSGGT
jgi:hypothetical protein